MRVRALIENRLVFLTSLLPSGGFAKPQANRKATDGLLRGGTVRDTGQPDKTPLRASYWIEGAVLVPVNLPPPGGKVF